MNIMKTKYVLVTLMILALIMPSCEKGFEEKNTNPILPTTIDPVYQLVTAEIIGIDINHYEGPIVQQIQLLLGGAEEGGNRNTFQDMHSNNHFNALYGTQIKNLVDMINVLKDKPEKVNLYNMARILKAYCFQILVDTYGDVPYKEAGLGYLTNNYLPKYDRQGEIYDDITKELEEAVDALDATKDRVSQEMYFTGDIAKWKKFGNSLLLRIGMRYTKTDLEKARIIVQKAVDPSRGGVMSSNLDNVVLKCNSIQTNPSSGLLTVLFVIIGTLVKHL
jgi:hypothetical protein